MSHLSNSYRISLAAILILAVGAPSLGYEFHLALQQGELVDGQEIVEIYDEEPLPFSINRYREFPFLVQLVNEQSAISTASRIVARSGDILDDVPAMIRDEDHQPKITDDGRVLFSTLDAVFFGDDVIHRAGDPLEGLDSPLDATLFRPAINQNLQIGFLGFITGEGAVVATPERVIAETGDVIAGKTLSNIYDVHVFQDGQVAFESAYLVENSPPLTGVFTADGALMLSGQIIQGRTVISPSFVGDMADGTLVYIGSDEDSGTRRTSIFTDETILVASGDIIAGKALEHLLFPSVNSKGQIAFTGDFDGGRGIFVDDQLVIQIGDMIDGHEVTQLDRAAINSNGDLAFSVQLENDDWAMAIATVPEPHGMSLIVAAVFCVCHSLRRRRGKDHNRL